MKFSQAPVRALAKFKKPRSGGKYEIRSWKSIEPFAVTAVVCQYSLVKVHCYSLTSYRFCNAARSEILPGNTFIVRSP